MSELEREVTVDTQSATDGAASSSERHSHHGHHSHYHGRHHHHSHHSHHSHHHSRHRSKGKKERNRRQFRQFIHKNRKKLIFICIALLFCLCSIAAGILMDRIVQWNDANKPISDHVVIEGQLRVSVSVFDQPVSLTHAATQAVMSSDTIDKIHDIYKQYDGVANRLDTGLPVTLSYAISGAPQGYMVSEAVFSVSEDEQMTNAQRLAPEKGQEVVHFVNLKSGTAYHYRLDITFTNGVKTAVLGQFTTAEGPRMLTVDGGYNMRDVGGWHTTDGKRVKQGLLYRGCELDGAVESKYTLTEEGKSTMLTQLNIKTDMDLRNEAEVQNPLDALGQNVKHTYYNMPMYMAVYESSNAETIRKIFADLATPAQYPAYIHCTYGQDRTGTVCYLLGALLGVEREDLMKDYALTGLCHGYLPTSEMNAFTRRLQQMPGVTLQEKAEGFLLSVGVTPAQIQTIRDTFLEEVK